MIKLDSISPCKEVIDEFEFLSFVSEHECRLFSLWDESLRVIANERQTYRVGQSQCAASATALDIKSNTSATETVPASALRSSKSKRLSNSYRLHNYARKNRNSGIVTPLHDVSQLGANRRLHAAARVHRRQSSVSISGGVGSGSAIGLANSTTTSTSNRNSINNSSSKRTLARNFTCHEPIGVEGDGGSGTQSPTTLAENDGIISKTLWPYGVKLAAIKIRTRIREYRADAQYSPENVHIKHRGELIRSNLAQLSTIESRHARYAVEALRLDENTYKHDARLYTFNYVWLDSLIAAKRTSEDDSALIPRIPAQAFIRAPRKRLLYDGQWAPHRAGSGGKKLKKSKLSASQNNSMESSPSISISMSSPSSSSTAAAALSLTSTPRRNSKLAPSDRIKKVKSGKPIKKRSPSAARCRPFLPTSMIIPSSPVPITPVVIDAGDVGKTASGANIAELTGIEADSDGSSHRTTDTESPNSMAGNVGRRRNLGTSIIVKTSTKWHAPSSNNNTTNATTTTNTTTTTTTSGTTDTPNHIVNSNGTKNPVTMSNSSSSSNTTKTSKKWTNNDVDRFKRFLFRYS